MTMGIYIKGMEMPTECGRCNAAFPNGVDYSCCLIKGYPLISSQRSTRLKNCPLIPVEMSFERKAYIGKTNVDRIRAMSVEELAAWIAEHPAVVAYDENNPQHRRWLDWLKQEA